MRHILMLALVACLAFAPIGVGSPIDGSTALDGELKDDVWSTARMFRGGQRASVIVIGSRENAANIELTVRDAKGKLIVEDKANGGLAGTIVAVLWYPPRDAEYRIEVRQPGAQNREFYCAIK